MTKRNEGVPTYASPAPAKEKGQGPDSAGQSGDNQGLSDIESAGSESVQELIEEGQFFEAGIVEGVENRPDVDDKEVRTREVPEDDVPIEYTGNGRQDSN